MTVSATAAGVKIGGVRIEQRPETLGLGTAEPRLSWIVETTASGWRQVAYEIEALEDDGQVRDHTGRIESDESVLVPWPFAPLRSRERLVARVRAWGSHGEASPWSAFYPVEVGLLSPEDW